MAMEQQGQKLRNIALKVVNVCKENVLIFGETKFDFKICSVSVCEDVFRLAHGLSASAMKQSVRRLAATAKSSGGFLTPVFRASNPSVQGTLNAQF